MDFIVFEASVEEVRHPSFGLWLCGNRDLRAVGQGDVLWIVTRMGGDRPMPGLCGRLLADRVVPHSPRVPGFDPAHPDSEHRLLVVENMSERCTPFACEAIAGWEIWRRPFGGVQELEAEQGRALEAAWKKGPRVKRG